MKGNKPVKRVICGALIVVLLIGVYAAISLNHLVKHKIPDMYAQWSVGEMVAAYYKKEQKWPKSWNDLTPFYDEVFHRRSFTLEELKARISIDFENLPLLEQPYNGTSPPEVVSAVSGIKTHWSGAEPNQLIHESFLRESVQP